MAAKRADVDGVPHITKGEILAVDFVSIPSNREARLVSARSFRPDEAWRRQVKFEIARAKAAIVQIDAMEAIHKADRDRFEREARARNPRNPRTAGAATRRFLSALEKGH